MAKKRTNPKKKEIDQYAHPDKQRTNNPPVGLVTPETDPVQPSSKTYEYDPHLDPQLVWAGKAERTSFAVPTVSLHVHERIDPKAIIRAVRSNGDRLGDGKPRQLSLFEEPDQNPPLRDALDFYKHSHGWTNRFIAGKSGQALFFVFFVRTVGPRDGGHVAARRRDYGTPPSRDKRW